MTTLFENVNFKSASGTANRTPAARWNDFINVKDFGATGDGATDDTTAIQAAFNAIPTTATSTPGIGGGPWGRVYFPAGSYKITSTINYQTQTSGSRNITIQGDGALASTVWGTLSGAAFTSSGYLFACNPGSSVDGPYAIRDMGFINKSTSTNSGCIAALGVAGGSIENCNFSGMKQVNLWGASVNGGTLVNSAAATAGATILTFATTVPAAIKAGWTIIDQTNNAIPGGASVTTASGTAITVSAAFTGTGVANGSTILLNGVFPNAGNLVKNCVFGAAPNSPVANTAAGLGSIGVQLGNSDSCYACTFPGQIDRCVKMVNAGPVCDGCFFNVCNEAVVIGEDDQGVTVGCSGFRCSSHSMEGIGTSVRVVGGCTGVIEGCSLSAEINTAVGENAQYGLDVTGLSYGAVIGCNPGGLFVGAAVKAPTNQPGITFIGVTANNSTGGSGATSSGIAWTGGNACTYIGCNQPATVVSQTFSSLGNWTPVQGQIVIVTDSTTTTGGVTISTGGGTATSLAMYSGSHWKSLGAI